MKKENSRPGLEKSSCGPVPGVGLAPEYCSKPKVALSVSVTHMQRSSTVSKSQPATHAVEKKKRFLDSVCTRVYVLELATDLVLKHSFY